MRLKLTGEVDPSLPIALPGPTGPRGSSHAGMNGAGVAGKKQSQQGNA